MCYKIIDTGDKPRAVITRVNTCIMYKWAVLVFLSHSHTRNVCSVIRNSDTWNVVRPLM